MARSDTTKPINPAQLTAELGGVALRHVAGQYVEADTTAAKLRAALDAHVADPAWTDPDAPAPVAEPSLADRLAAVETEVRGMKNRAAAEAAKASPTAKGVAAAVAADSA